MVQRTVSVGLVANVNNYVANMHRAEVATSKTAAAVVGSEKSLRAQGEAMSKVGTVMVGAGALAAAGLALVVKATADYGAKMAQLQSLSHASAAEMKQLSAAAMTVGQAYGFSASQVADAEIELTKAGIGVKAQLGGALKGALTLAAAGQLDVAQATEITTVAMTQFKLSAKDVPHVADLLAAGADKALGSVGDLGEALKNGGLQAHNMGLTIDDTVGLLSAFANAGIIGAEAGTQMRSMFIQLQRPSSQARAELEKYHIALSDTSGKFVGVTALAGELQEHLGHLSQAERNTALATIFGSHAITGATVLYQDGAKGIAGWIRGVNDSGFASAQAAGKMNSLQGDAQKLSATFETDLIKAGSGVSGAFRGVVQDTTGVLKAFGDLNPTAQSAVTIGAAVTAGVGLLGGAFLIATPKVLEFQAALTEANISGRGLAGTFGKTGGLLLVLTSVASGFAAMGQQGVASTAQIEQAGLRIQQNWKGVGDAFKSAGAGLNSGSGLKDAIDGLGDGGFFADSSAAKALDGMTFGISHLSDVYKSNEGTFDAMGQQLAGLAKTNYSAAANSFGSIVTQYKLTGAETQNLLRVMPAYRDELVSLAGKAHINASEQNLVNLAQGKGSISARVAAVASREAAAAAASQASQLAELTGSGNAATTSMKTLHDALAGLGSTELDARSAARDFQQAIDDATAAAAKNGRTLDINTQAGRDNASALDNIAKTADTAAAAFVNNGGSAKGAAAIIASARAKYIKTAEAMGESKSAANKLADALHLIPGDISTIYKLAGTKTAMSQIAAAQAKLEGLNGSVAKVYIEAVTQSRVPGSVSAALTTSNNEHGTIRRAEGGPITGPGPKGKDSVLIYAAPGEHVLTAREVDKMGGQAGVYAFRKSLDAYAAGGAIGDAGSARRSAGSDVIRYTDQLTAAKRRLTAANAAAARADKVVDAAGDAAAKISGKGTAARKHAAELATRAARKKAADAKTAAEKQSKLVDSLSSKIDAAKQRNEAAQQTQQTLQNSSEDFVSTQNRATAANPIDPLSYVDQLRSMSRDDSYSSTRQKSYDAAANKYEKALVTLTTQSQAAAQKLSDLSDASTQMKSSITSAIAGGYQASGAGSMSQASGWIQQDGIQYQTTTSAISAASLDDYYRQGATDTGTFASQLQQLAQRGVNGALLAEIAGYGVAQGSPIAAALLGASTSQIGSINSDYAAIQGNAGAAGATVADANYQALIESAQTNADQITAQIASDGEKLRKLIASAFGLPGYATGTTSATAGIHLVGENGPELQYFRGGEGVLNASRTSAYMRGGGSFSGQGKVVVQAPQVQFPDTITVRDASGFTATMEVIADRRIAADQMQDTVLEWGGAA